MHSTVATTETGAMRFVISANKAWNIVNFRMGLVHALLDRGHSITAVTPMDTAVGALLAEGCEHLPVQLNAHGTNPLQDISLIRQYRRIYRSLPPTIALHFTIKPVIYGTLATRNTKVVAINTITGLGTAFLRGGALEFVSKALYRFSQRTAAAVAFHNEDDRLLLETAGAISPSVSCVIPGSGIDTERFASCPLPGPEETRFLMISRLLRDKGVREFVEAARMVKTVCSKSRFTLVGEHDPSNPNAIPFKEIEGAVADGVIDYVGELGDVRPEISRAACVVLPSYREGAPRALIEAGCMGRPLIATDVPGCRSVVVPGLNGFLCEVQSAKSLSEAMRDFCALSQYQREKMGLDSQDYVAGKFSKEQVINAYLKLSDKAWQEMRH